MKATSTVICLEAGGFRLDHSWQLKVAWRAQAVTVELWNSQGHGILRLERAVRAGERMARCAGSGRRRGTRPLGHALLNTFPIRRAPEGTGVCLTLDTAFIDGPALTVTRSTQRYDRQGPGRLRYVDVDLGLARGLVADLVVDDRGLVLEL